MKKIILAFMALCSLSLASCRVNKPTEKPSIDGSNGSTTLVPSEGSSSTLPTEGSTTNTPSAGSSSTLPTEGSTTNIPSAGSSSTLPTEGSTTNIPSAGTTTNPTESSTAPVDEWIIKNIDTSNVVVNQAFELLGTTSRSVPTEGNEGLERYPNFGTSLPNITLEEKQALISESNYLRSSASTYDSMDSEGNLYLNGEKLERKLYKHSASLNMFYGNVDEDEEAVIKKITINPRPRGNHITGLYAPAGEVIKIEISQADLEATGGVKVELGQFSQNNELNNIWEARNDFSRMPHIGNEMLVNDTVGYVGTFLGGPIYLTPVKPVSFSVTISGAVEYCHFIYGLTTKEEFNRLKDKSAPFFDLEVWDKCVRHSGPKAYANFDYDNLMKISEFYIATSNISRRVPSGSAKDLGINFIYDPFVCAGSAVALVGRNWCNLPVSWMKDSLNYDSFTQNGMWGTIHEYNHHFQRYGFNPGDEVTNNALNLLSYINNTKISAKRHLGLRDWNRFLDPMISFTETLNLSGNGNEKISSLSSYSDIIHTFGVETFLKACELSTGGGAENWYKALSSASGYDMSYYFKNILHHELSDEVISNFSDKPLYIPAVLKYQTGRIIDGNVVKTVLPYTIKNGEAKLIDLNTDLLLPEGFTYIVKNVINPTNGTLVKNEDGTYSYTPDGNKESKDITFTITITNGEITTDLTFVVEFTPDYLGIDATRYTYSSNVYTDIESALKNNFSGYESISNEDINKHFVNGIGYYQTYVYSGKFYIPNDGNYRFAIRTSNRSNTLGLFSLNNDSLKDKIDSRRENPVNINDDYISYDCKKGDYVYFKVIIQSFHPDGFAEIFSSFNGGAMTSVNTSYLYNTKSAGYTSYVLNDQYPRTIPAENLYADLKKQSIVSYTTSYQCWDDNYKIENILDGNNQKSYHSIKGKYITSEPFEVIVDLGDTFFANTFNFVTYNGNLSHAPTKFKLYGGLALDELELLGEYEGIKPVGRNLNVTFETSEIRYYKLVITETSNKQYVAISDMNMSLTVNGNIEAPDYAKYFTNSKTDFMVFDTLSTFGNGVNGNGLIKLNANNGILGIFTNNEEDAVVRITIDGKESDYTISKGHHKLSVLLNLTSSDVIIEVVEGNIIIESFIV